MSSVLCLPFHQDERFDLAVLALPPGVHRSVLDPDPSGTNQWDRLIVVYEALATAVEADLDPSWTTTVLTGDCLALLGTLAGAQRGGLDPGLVWFDAHGDVHTMSSTTSGYLGGMALRMALGSDADRLAQRLSLRPVAADRVVLVDARDLDPAEEDFLATSPVRRRTVRDLRPADLPAGPLLLHIDLDVVDAAATPGLRFPSAGGPSAADVLSSAGRLVDTGQVRILSIACTWYPAVDSDEQRAREALISQLLDGLVPRAVH
jgi:arginase